MGKNEQDRKPASETIVAIDQLFDQVDNLLTLSGYSHLRQEFELNRAYNLSLQELKDLQTIGNRLVRMHTRNQDQSLEDRYRSHRYSFEPNTSREGGTVWFTSNNSTAPLRGRKLVYEDCRAEKVVCSESYLQYQSDKHALTFTIPGNIVQNAIPSSVELSEIHRTKKYGNYLVPKYRLIFQEDNHLQIARFDYNGPLTRVHKQYLQVIDTPNQFADIYPQRGDIELWTSRDVNFYLSHVYNHFAVIQSNITHDGVKASHVRVLLEPGLASTDDILDTHINEQTLELVPTNGSSIARDIIFAHTSVGPIIKPIESQNDQVGIYPLSKEERRAFDASDSLVAADRIIYPSRGGDLQREVFVGYHLIGHTFVETEVIPISGGLI